MLMPQARPKARELFVSTALVLIGMMSVLPQGAYASSSLPADDAYPPTPDSLPQATVQAGTLFKFSFDRSIVFPGTTREITVYVPTAYESNKPACVYIGLDGLAFDAPTVFDNLIARHEIPVLIAIGIAPGTVPSRDSPNDPRYNRSAEFDDLSDRLAQFVLTEVLPEVQRRTLADGRAVRLSTSPNDRAVGGSSTGGIGAFTLAWRRPDAFRRVFTAIGTFVDMRGGDHYPSIVRKTEPKPIKVFMQDGSNDELTDVLGEMGDWWLGNQNLHSALTFAGYDVEHAWGTGNHSAEHATRVFPDAMRWLWKGWPQPITAGESKNVFLKSVLSPGEDWEAIAEVPPRSQSPASGRHVPSTQGPLGRVYTTVASAGQVWLRTPDGRRTLLDSGLNGPTGIALSPDGLWLAVAESRTRRGYSYRVESDGTLRDKQGFYEFERTSDEDASGVTAWVMDREGRLYAATPAGVQVFDRNGRVRAILPVPLKLLSDLRFGGEKLDYLYVSGSTSTDNRRNEITYRRKLKVPGMPPGSAPIRLPPWGPS